MDFEEIETKGKKKKSKGGKGDKESAEGANLTHIKQQIKQMKLQEAEEEKASKQAQKADDVSDDDEDEQWEVMDKNPDYPLKVHYCKWCKVPAEYCYLLSENLDKCKEWLLKERKPDLIALYEEIYGERP